MIELIDEALIRKNEIANCVPGENINGQQRVLFPPQKSPTK